MKMQLDWKFVVGLVAAIAGVLVPVWLWRADLVSRAMHFKVGSTVPLQPQGHAPLDGLAITIDDAKIESPYLTVLELHNDGTRPVPSADFESPIRVVAAAPTKVVRARLLKTSPRDLPLKFTVENGEIVIQPLLLNPGDFVEIVVLTSGPAPNFRPIARIAGVRDLPIVSESDGKPRYASAAIMFFGAFLCSLPAGTLLSIGFRRAAGLRPRVTVLTALVTGVTGAMLVLNALKQMGIEGFWPYAGATFMLFIVALPLGVRLNARSLFQAKSE